MAYVALSQTLLEDIRRGINAKRATEASLIDAPSLSKTISPTDPLYIKFEEKMWGSYAHLRGTLPIEWCRNLSSGRLFGGAEVPSVEVDQETGDAKKHYISVSMNISFSPPLSCPPNAETYNVGIRVDDALKDPDLAPLVTFEAQCREITAKWNSVWDQVNGFLGKCKSLNQALKLWPDLRVYIPSSYLKKVDAVVERTKSSENAALEALKNVDTDAVVANAVMVRILAASKDSNGG